MNKIMKISTVAVAVALIAAPFVAFGQTNLPVECTGFWCNLNLTNFGVLIQWFAKFLMAIALVLAVISIVWGGIQYMYGGEEGTGAAKKRIFNGVIGAAVVLGVGVILQLVANLVSGSIFQ